MADSIIKLALWRTKTFTPIMSHQELESIMVTLGFTPLPVTNNIPCNIDDGSGTVLWKEYSYSSCSCYKGSSSDPPPRPRLPYPVIDGLHVCAYQAFLYSVNFYRRFDDDLSDIFHIRGMTLNRVHDKSGNWSLMEETDKNKFNLYVYRDGLYDISVYKSWKANKNDVHSSNNKSNRYNTSNVFNRRSNILAGCKFISMKDVVVQSLTNPKSKNYSKGEQYKVETD